MRISRLNRFVSLLIVAWLVISPMASAFGTVFTAATATPADFQAKEALTADGDTIIVPIGSGVFTSPVIVHHSISIIGTSTNGASGTLWKSTQATAGGDPSTMTMLQLFCSGSSIVRVANIQFTNSANAGAAAVFGGNGKYRIDSCVFGSFKFATYTYGPISIDHNTFINCILPATCYNDGFGSNVWFTDFPLQFTNITHFNDQNHNTYIWNSSNPYTGGGFGHALSASGQGAAYQCRNGVVIASDSEPFQPAFDAHGDQAPGTDIGTRTVVIAGMQFTLSGPASMDKFFDHRGGMAAVYSNSLNGVGISSTYISVRDEHPGMNPEITPDPDCLGTNSYYAYNFANGVIIPWSTNGDLYGHFVLGTQFFTNLPVVPYNPFVAPENPLALDDPLNVGPNNQTTTAPAPATFTVTSSSQSSLPITWQWMKNGVPIAGATQSAYTTPPTTSGDNGAIFSVASTDVMATVTNQATLFVNAGQVSNPPYTNRIPQGKITKGHIL